MVGPGCVPLICVLTLVSELVEGIPSVDFELDSILLCFLLSASSSVLLQGGIELFALRFFLSVFSRGQSFGIALEGSSVGRLGNLVLARSFVSLAQANLLESLIETLEQLQWISSNGLFFLVDAGKPLEVFFVIQRNCSLVVSEVEDRIRLFSALRRLSTQILRGQHFDCLHCTRKVVVGQFFAEIQINWSLRSN